MYAKLLLGRSPLDIENHWNNMFSTVNFFGFAGAEMRAISAVDVALWDILGQHTGQPIYNLLGGRNRDQIMIYNTCVGHGKHQDYNAWAEGHTGELAVDLLKSGVKAMKIWPFGQFGVSLDGPISQREQRATGTARLKTPPAVEPVLSQQNLKKRISSIPL